MSGDDEISNVGTMCVFVLNGFIYHFWMRESVRVLRKAQQNIAQLLGRSLKMNIHFHIL